MAGVGIQIVSVLDSDYLNRRLVSFHVKQGVVTSAAYKMKSKPDPEASVDLARLTTIDESLQRGGDPTKFGLGQLPASVPLQRPELTVEHNPLPDNVAHTLIKDNTRKTCRILAENTEILRMPAIRE